MYDYLIVGAGLFGAVLADLLTSYGKKVLVVEQKNVVGGTCYTDVDKGITVHRYGAHIFRTNHDYIWNYVNRFVHFKPFINSPLAYVDGNLYNLPFNMNTFHQLWGVTTPHEAVVKIEDDKCHYDYTPGSLEEYALSKVGKTIYEKFIKGYTEKQWGKECIELPASILGRLPLRFTYDNNYYSNKLYQGVPVEGYTVMIERMLKGATVDLEADYRDYIGIAKHTVFTGSIDEYYDYRFGKLEYRSLRFEHESYCVENIQGNAVINYTEKMIPYTRSIEHKHFLGEESPYTIVSKEYPCEYDGNNERYYPIETDNNLLLYKKYASIVTDTIFAGRLGSYKYTDMEQTVQNAMELALHLRYLD